MLRGSSGKAVGKMNILRPDVPYSSGGLDFHPEAVQLDVAGHYRDDRVGENNDVPHVYSEDMDHENDKGNLVPVYLKSGLRNIRVSVPREAGLDVFSPMFYRPYREWELPKPGERDFKKQIADILAPKVVGGNGKDFTLPLDAVEKMGFAHTSFGLNAGTLLRQPYLQSIMSAQRASGQKFGVGVFLQQDVRFRAEVKDGGWNLVDSDGSVEYYYPDRPTLFCLGAQPQATTTGLFLSANIPNLVTGDLTLSDAIYGLIAMEGPAFFYETASWKFPTHSQLFRILQTKSELVARDYLHGSNNAYWYLMNLDQNGIAAARDHITRLFVDGNAGQKYRDGMRDALRDEIRTRFGDVQVDGGLEGKFYIQPGARYLFQDATAQVATALVMDDVFRMKMDRARDKIAGRTNRVRYVPIEPIIPPQTPEEKVPYNSPMPDFSKGLPSKLEILESQDHIFP
jgi:hypothetical protein